MDIYSLGIIFFELYKPFSTAMQRAEEIERLKNGVFPDGFVELYPKEVKHKVRTVRFFVINLLVIVCIDSMDDGS